MGKKINVMGVSLDNNPIRGSLLILDKLINDPALNLAQIVDARYLSLCSSDAMVKEYLEGCDHSVIQDEAILKEANETSGQRLSEARSGRFFEEFMKRLNRSGRTVFLLGASNEDLQGLRNYLTEHFNDIRIVGEFCLDESDPEGEKAVNCMNEAAPQVILSILPSPEQEIFYLNHKSKLFANLFFGAGGTVPYKNCTSRLGGFIQRIVSKRVLASTQRTDLSQWLL